MLAPKSKFPYHGFNPITSSNPVKTEGGNKQVSKLLDLLNQVLQETPAPLGFGASRKQEKRPTLLLIGQSTANSKKQTDVGELGLQAMIWSEVKKTPNGKKQDNQVSPSDTAKSSSEIPWGVNLSTASEKEISALKKAGCDFVVISDTKFPITALTDKELGKLLAIDSSITEAHQRILEALPIDAFLLDFNQESSTPTLHDLMDLLALVIYIDKPIILKMRMPPDHGELEILRNSGIDGILLNLENTNHEEIGRVKKDILNLPPRREKPERGTAFLPQTQIQHSHQHEPDESEDDFEDD